MKSDEIINTGDIEWKAQARALMIERKIFLVDGWKNSFNRDESTALALEFDYMFTNDPEKSTAIFRPKNEMQ